MANIIGSNVKIFVSKKVDGKLVIEIDTNEEGTVSKTGRSMIVATSDGFANLEEILGLEGMALNLVLTRKKVKKVVEVADDEEEEEEEDEPVKPTRKKAAAKTPAAPAKPGRKKRTVRTGA